MSMESIYGSRAGVWRILNEFERRGLQRFLDHIEAHDHVWVAHRVDIARHWATHHPAVQG